MSKQITTPTTQDFTKGLEIVELEQRLEMVHLTAVEAEASSRCDIDGDVELPEIEARIS
ncbi:hypothetical protein QWY85_09050 [Neolewinella lacunae]|uniref:Uncharacterized protein n=1 Tax=Neolewinella lacunae TaxID=1517758 RepID=A0A923PM66_9BACT|nr:hypothetical protein [Neolewinella lacunae]MBC6996632.1 hypothetical protein [Neolewinella lacunae]MDN3634804.1 hypothetical protein [Neolewinella lacunae]